MKLDWNMGGWFGSQLGGTAWILVSAAITLTRDIPTGLLLLLIFSLPNIAGLFFWYKRILSCYLSMQVLLASMGLSGLLAIYVLERKGLWLEIQKGGAISAESGYLLLGATVLVVMASLHLKFGRHRNSN